MADMHAQQSLTLCDIIVSMTDQEDWRVYQRIHFGSHTRFHAVRSSTGCTVITEERKFFWPAIWWLPRPHARHQVFPASTSHMCTCLTVYHLMEALQCCSIVPGPSHSSTVVTAKDASGAAFNRPASQTEKYVLIVFTRILIL